MSALHTKGPWRYSPWHIEEAPSAVYDAENNLVCTTSSDDTARLIAAAPDMLEALVKCVAMLEALKAESGRPVEWGEEDAFRMGEWFEKDDLIAIDAAHAAIARATGAKP